jgi:hypothetical protein
MVRRHQSSPLCVRGAQLLGDRVKFELSQNSAIFESVDFLI